MTEKHDLVFRSALLTLAVLLPSMAEAQGYTLSQTTRSFQSIAGSGTMVTVSDSDDGTGTVSLPFSLSFFGASVSTVYPSTNGLLATAGATTDYRPTTIPTSATPNGFIAGFWRDMQLTGVSGGIYTKTDTDLSGNAIVTIEWNSLQIYNSTGNTITYQIKLYETGDLIEIAYGARSGTGASAGIGVEDSTGTRGTAQSCSPACSFTDLPEGTVLTFTPVAGGSGADLSIDFVSGFPSSGRAGDPVSGSLDVLNNGDLMSSATTVIFYMDTVNPPSPSTGVSLGSANVTSIPAFGSVSPSFNLSLPSVSSGLYYIGAAVNVSASALESNYANNTYTVGSISISGGGGTTITVTTNSLPAARSGTAYSAQLQQSGASSPSWALSSGSLPSGMFLSSSGLISGTPNVTGSYPFQVECAQPGYTSGFASLTLTVNNGGGGSLSIVTTSLPQATVGGALSGQRIEASGGTPPYAFQTVSGAPSWFRMDSDGNVTGTPDAPGNHQIHISVFDSALGNTEGVVSLEVVQGGPLTITTESLVGGVVGVAYSGAVAAQGGFSPYQFSVASGSLPAGLSLSSEGLISGTPTAMGSSTFEVEVRDAMSTTQRKSYSIAVIERTALSISVPATISLRYNQAAEVKLVAAGGVPPYQWTMAGLLPAGVTLIGDTLSGTPTSTKATAMVTFQVRDSEGATAEKLVTVEVTKGGNQTPARPGGGTRRDGGCSCVLPERSGSGLSLSLLGISFLVLRSMASRSRRNDRWLVTTTKNRTDEPRSSRP